MAEAAEVRLVYASDQSLLVEFGRASSTGANPHVLRLLRAVAAGALPGVLNLHPACSSLLIRFDPLRTAHAAVEQTVLKLLDRLDDLVLPEPRTVEIPVCYGLKYGPDLEEVAALHGMTAEQAAELHASANYTVCFLGFAPGFGYLAGLPAALATPRLDSPRGRVPAGSVGIAGDQTGVYPLSTPGGWRLIGRTPLDLYRPDHEPMTLLQIGDRVRFLPIPHERFRELYHAPPPDRSVLPAWEQDA
jgi:inhibitor of KinA